MAPHQSPQFTAPKMATAKLSSKAAVAERQAWMALLARSNAEELSEALGRVTDCPAHQIIRAPETGLVMARGRAGGQGQMFNLGEVTVTRATVKLDTGEIGQAYIRGRSKAHAESAALCDALLQRDDLKDGLQRTLLGPIEDRLDKAKAERQSKVAATKVDFFTMVRGED